MTLNQITYQCDHCKNVRRLSLSDENQDFIRDIQNGLSIYSDYHKCVSGLLGVNNIHVDDNLNVRTVEKLQLPIEKELKKSQLMIPSPASTNNFAQLTIAEISNVKSFKFVLVDIAVKFQLTVGKIRLNQPIFDLKSKQESVFMEFYGEEALENPNIEAWMQVFIDLIETLPPTKFGLLIESLRHIQSLIKVEPTSFHVNMIKTILVSQDIFFEAGSNINNKGALLETVTEDYGSDVAFDIAVLLDKILQSPELALIEFTKISKTDMITLIYLILILEQEQAIIVHRPKLIEFE